MVLSVEAADVRSKRSQLWNSRKWILFEALFLYGLVIALLFGATRIPWPWFRGYLSLVSAILFLYVPIGVLWLQRIPLERYGIRFRPLVPALKAYGVLSIVTFSLFLIAYYLVWHYQLCQKLHIPTLLVRCSSGPLSHPPLPDPLSLWMLSTVILVALPEECFFRGYLQGRLSELMSPYLAVILGSVFFALGHWIVLGNPATLLVFFPGLLFGWLRLRTRSIVAGTLFHASCNILMEFLHHWFF